MQGCTLHAYFILYVCIVVVVAGCNPKCVNGDCVNGKCECNAGWTGRTCDRGKS